VQKSDFQNSGLRVGHFLFGNLVESVNIQRLLAFIFETGPCFSPSADKNPDKIILVNQYCWVVVRVVYPLFIALFVFWLNSNQMAL
jgi:hypothetical protein